MTSPRSVSRFTVIAILLPWAVAGFRASAQTLTRTQSDFFENKIRPILSDNCYKCHSAQAEKVKGDLRLDTRQGLLKGGASGPAIVPGNPDKSLLIKAVRYTDPDLQMPPRGPQLSDTQVADLAAWVKMGAPDPRTTPKTTSMVYTTSRDHWSFKPIQNPPVPEVKAADWIKTPIDAFVLKKLEANGLTPNPPADKRTLIRRATFDLIGLPPTQPEIKEFLDDASPDAFAKVVDRLLASPRYGERWGRYWLDTARYADTKGEVKKNVEDSRYPFAWTYRDYVIRAFNNDLPFNRFILEQIAADQVVKETNKTDLAAMGFLTVGERFGGNKNDVINDRIDVVTKGFLGLTVTCARCHDHKFDPIPTKDYYALHGVFNSSVEMSPEIISKVDAGSPAYLAYSRSNALYENQLVALEAERKANRTNRLVVKAILDKEGIVRAQWTDLQMTNAAAPARAMVLNDLPKPMNSPVFIHGEAENRGDLVPREFLEILSPTNRVPFKYGSGRLELAADIASKANPLTARVIVNRVWLHHFDAGIVTTPDDFGNQSAPPSHPELLDYLATRFIADGWSIKQLHRLIMLSSVYQESSEGNPRYAQVDPENRWLWRANIRRMDFEEIRDSMLAIGGKLDETMYGRPVNLGSYPYSTRRTIYGYVDRLNPPEVYNQFDVANPEATMGKRYETIVPQQSLFLMNSPLVIEQARNLVDRPDFAALTNDEARVGLLYELVYQRAPTPTEIQLGLDFVNHSPENEAVPKMFTPKVARPNRDRRLEASFAAVPAGERKPLAPWEKYAHALLQANEAVFIN